MGHTCSAIIVHCIDFRLGPAISDWLKSEKLMGDCDIVGIAGAAKNFNGEKDEDVLMTQIEISSKLHEIKKVILMNHTDCGAYGGRAAFENREVEDTTHSDALSHGADVLKEKLPHLEVQKMIAQIEPDGTIHIESII
ncbi:MAG: hypothetical protein CMI52_03705 [Parcubacteria group bacterium]|nr:hypothetical protein [Parcubacteria group bacterium]|tara:strand:- start:483 stop:896 length:414 start_codon:yes stop_codon:yes gene_type:complete